MAAFVQAAKDAVSTGTTVVVSLPGGIAAGSIIVCAGGFDPTSATSATLTDGHSDAVTDSGLGFIANGAIPMTSYVKAFLAPTTGAQTITATFNAAVGYADLVVWEFSGLTSPQFDKVVSASTGTNPSDSGPTGTLSAAVEAAIAYGCTATGFTGAGTGWTITVGQDGITPITASVGEHQVTTTNASINGTAPNSGGTAQMWVATFMSGGAPPVTPAWGWDQVVSQTRQTPRSKLAAAWMFGEAGIESPRINWRNAGWETQSHQPKHPRPERAASWLRGDDGSEAKFIPPINQNFWGWEVSDQLRRWMPASRRTALDGDIGFASFNLNPWWESQDWSTRFRRYTQHQDWNVPAVFVPPAASNFWGWDPTLLQMPRPPRGKAAGAFFGEVGIQAPLINFIPYGWPVQPWQPPHPRPERSGAWMRGDDGTQGNFVFTAAPAWGWDVQPVQPPFRINRLPAMLRGDDGAQSPFIMWRNAGWEVAPHQPGHPRTERAGAVMLGAPGNEAPFVFNFIPLNFWEVALPPAYRRRWERAAATMRGDDGTQAALIQWSNFGWPVAPHQPQHPRPERAAAIMAGDPGNENVFTFTSAPIIPGWEIAPALAYHLRRERAAAVMRGDDGTQAGLSRWLNSGWEVQSPQPPHPRPERAGAWLPGEPAIQSPFVRWVNAGWEVQPPQPPHPRPERAAAWLAGDPGTEAPFIFIPFTFPGMGWDVPFYPPRRFLRIPAFLQGDPGNQAAFQRWFNAGWEVQPPQPPHPRPERSAGFLIGDDGDYSPFIFVPPFSLFGWDSNVPQPRYARWGRGVMPFPVGLDILIPGSSSIPTQNGCVIYGRASRATFYGKACEC